MGALTKLCSHFCKYTAIFFSVAVPQVIRLIILTLQVLRIKYKWARSKYNYAALINKKSFKFVYRRSKLRPDLLNCTICLSDFVDGEEGRELIMCKHRFHRKCIEKWLQGKQATCPLCRHLLLPEEIVAEHQRVQSEQADNRSEVELALLFLSALHGRNCHRFL